MLKYNIYYGYEGLCTFLSGVIVQNWNCVSILYFMGHMVA
jgi:hypothetical protein